MKFDSHQLRARCFTLGVVLLVFVCFPAWKPLHSRASFNPVQQAYLTKVTVSFFTRDDDKDHDTRIIVYLYLPDGRAIGKTEIPNEYFPDNTRQGPFPLSLNEKPMIGEIMRGTTTIRISPNGNDTWRFDYRIELHFSDRNHIVKDYKGIELNENNKDITFQLN
jgi:hypothetical protein